MDCRHSFLFTCNMCEKNENKLVDKIQKIEERLTRLEQIDEQTRMFWNLQLQFLEMNYKELLEYVPLHIAHKCIKNVGKGQSVHEFCATELALQLSGLK